MASPRAVIGLALCIWLALVGGLTRLQIRTDGRALVPADSAAVATAREIDAEFGLGDELVLVVGSRGERGIWDADFLSAFRDLASSLAAVESVDATSIQSIATENGDHVLPGSLEPLPWFVPWPESADELDSLRMRIERIDLYRGTLLSTESPARSASIVFRLNRDVDRRAGCAAVQNWLAESVVPNVDTYIVGAALAEARLGDHLLQDLTLLVPGALLLMALVLFMRFRSLWAALLPLAGVGLVLTTTFALLGWSGAHVYLTLLVLPVVLTVVGVADAIHLLDDYFHRVDAHPDLPARELLRRALARQWKPILSAELTTAVGFLSFAFSPLPPVRVFGTFASLGVALYSCWSLAVLPAALMWLETRGLRTRRIRNSRASRQKLGAYCSSLARLSQRRPGWVVGGSLVILVACVHGLSLLRVEDSWLSGFSESSKTYADAKRFEREFSGIHTLRLRVSAPVAELRGVVDRSAVRGDNLLLPQIHDSDAGALVHSRLRLVPIDAASNSARGHDFEVLGSASSSAGTELTLRNPRLPGVTAEALLDREVLTLAYELSAADRFFDPGTLALVCELESFAAEQEVLGVSRVLGPCGHLRTLEVMLGTNPEIRARRLHTHEGIKEAVDLYDRGRGRARRLEFWTSSGDRTLINVLLRDASYIHVGELMKRLRAFESRALTPHGLKLDFGGDLAQSQALIDGIVTTQVGSLLGSVLGNAFVIALALLSWRFGLLSAIPCALAVAGNFALMGWTGVSVGVATSMFAAMTIGVGLDWAIHLIRAVRHRMIPGGNIEVATLAAFEDVGPAVVVDALCVGLGFGLLLFSSVPPSRHLGLVLVSSLFTCLFATLVLLPALLAVGRRRT
ncbi:MAG: MMPL family transporter [Planctomycetes bacterium]|nr:MMPL family transporter [Planctomycetota bacterium]